MGFALEALYLQVYVSYVEKLGCGGKVQIQAEDYIEHHSRGLIHPNVQVFQQGKVFSFLCSFGLSLEPDRLEFTEVLGKIPCPKDIRSASA